MSYSEFQPPERSGHLTIPVLQHIWGQPWPSDLVVGMLTALRPSHVRVSLDAGDVLGDNAVLWRVTILVRDGIVCAIEQEVQIGLDNLEANNGHELYNQYLHEPTKVFAGLMAGHLRAMWAENLLFTFVKVSNTMATAFYRGRPIASIGMSDDMPPCYEITTVQHQEVIATWHGVYRCTTPEKVSEYLQTLIQ